LEKNQATKPWVKLHFSNKCQIRFPSKLFKEEDPQYFVGSSKNHHLSFFGWVGMSLLQGQATIQDLLQLSKPLRTGRRSLWLWRSQGTGHGHATPEDFVEWIEGTKGSFQFSSTPAFWAGNYLGYHDIICRHKTALFV